MEKWDETYRASQPFIDKMKGKTFTEFIKLVNEIEKTVYIPIANMPREPDLQAQLEFMRNIEVYVSIIHGGENKFLGWVISKDEKDFYTVINLFIDELRFAHYQTKH